MAMAISFLLNFSEEKLNKCICMYSWVKFDAKSKQHIVIVILIRRNIVLQLLPLLYTLHTVAYSTRLHITATYLSGLRKSWQVS